MATLFVWVKQPNVRGAMNIRDVLESAMEAERQRQAVTSRMAMRREMLGMHAGGGTSISKGTVLDPMRQVDECLDAEASDSMLLEQLEVELDEAWQLIGGISEMGSDDGAQVLCRHYLWLEPWQEIARSIGHTEDECQQLAEMTLKWADEIGAARLRQKSLGKWPAIAPVRNRRWKSR